MKSTLEFNLPEDQSDLELALAAAKLMLVIRNLDDTLRSQLKYGTNEKLDDSTVEHIRSELHLLIEENGLHSIIFD